MIETNAESILTLKNRESIHFGLFGQRFREKESIHDTCISPQRMRDNMYYSHSWQTTGKHNAKRERVQEKQRVYLVVLNNY